MNIEYSNTEVMNGMKDLIIHKYVPRVEVQCPTRH